MSNLITSSLGEQYIINISLPLSPVLSTINEAFNYNYSVCSCSIDILKARYRKNITASFSLKEGHKRMELMVKNKDMGSIDLIPISLSAPVEQEKYILLINKIKEEYDSPQVKIITPS